MNHDTGKSRKLNDEDMTEMQSLASDILLMERGQSKAVTGKEHLERNDFIIEKQKAELTPSGEIGDTHGQAQRRSHRCRYGHSKRSGFSFRQRKNEETGTIQ